MQTRESREYAGQVWNPQLAFHMYVDRLRLGRVVSWALISGGRELSLDKVDATKGKPVQAGKWHERIAMDAFANPWQWGLGVRSSESCSVVIHGLVSHLTWPRERDP